MSAAVPEPSKPYIVQEPRNTTVREGEDAELECRIISEAHPVLQWVKHYKVNGSYTNEDDESYVDVIQVREAFKQDYRYSVYHIFCY